MAEQFSRLRLPSKYVKITSEEDIKNWAKNNDTDTKCSVCEKKIQFRDSFELENEFVARFTCENHKRIVHYSFKFYLTKSKYDELKKDDKPTTVQIKVPKKKKESKKKTITQKKTTGNNSKKATNKKPTTKKKVPKAEK